MNLALSIGLAAHGYMPNTNFMVTGMVMFNSCKQADQTIIFYHHNIINSLARRKMSSISPNR